MNGNPVISIKKTGNPGTITEISVGSYLLNGVYWNGAIDDLRFYDRVLNDDEIEMLAGL